MRILVNTLLFLFFSTAAWSATNPVIFYSDLTSGPNTGGQNNAGLFVTVWGNNFGSTQGSSTVTVGGGAVANIQSWSNTEICFQLGSSAATGNIVVTTSNGASNGLPFTVRSGNIYFVQPGASTNGTGTYASPFNHLWYAYNIITAGDTVYVMSGTITDEANGYTNYHSILCTTVSGTQASPIAWVAYPNATAIIKADYASMTWTDGSSGGGDTAQYIFNYNGGNWNTFSKFTLQLTPGYTAIQTGNATGWRIVGNNLTASSYSYAIIELGSNSLANNTEILGNEIHDSGAGQSENNEDHSIYWDGGGANVEIAWNYLHGNVNTGWEISCFHQGQRNGSIHDNLIIAGGAGSVKGILLGDVDSGETESTEEASTYNVYNNILVNLGQYENGGVIQAVSGTAYIYNNTIYGSGTETMGVLQFPTGGIGPGGGHPVWYVANNIIVANNSGLYLSDENGNAPSWTNFALLTNNNYYGEGNGPSQDAKPLNVNPQLVAPSTAIGGNFQLQSTSPDINAGYNTISMVTKDLSGLLRSSTPSIGAYEYTGSVAPTSPVVAITSPTSGSTVTAGSNITITATASETNGTIRNISLYNGAGVLLGSSSSSPYNYVLTNPVAGSYTFSAVATDANGLSSTSIAVMITVTPQSSIPSPPVVTITSPVSGSNFKTGSNVTITTTASETNGTIKNISLYSGSGVLLGSSSTSPYNYVYNSILAGGYTFYAVATDANGVTTTSSNITITVNSVSNTSASGTTIPSASQIVDSKGTVWTLVHGNTFQNGVADGGGGSSGNIALLLYYNGLVYADTTNDGWWVWTTGWGRSSGDPRVSNVAPSISTQPASVTVTAPATASFSVVATGTPAPTYQWMVSVNGGAYSIINGATGSSYTTPATTTAYNGNQYVCVITNAAGSVTSTNAILTVYPTPPINKPGAPSITTQPVNTSVTAPATATFSVVATGTPAPTYQWMKSVNGGAYSIINGAISSSYTTPATTTANNGNQYVCVITNASGSVTSTNAILTVYPTLPINKPGAPSITSQPVNTSVTAPATASFSVVATGTPAPTYQWMVSVNGGAYSIINGAISSSYTTPATTTANNGNQYVCVITNASGSVTSTNAILTVYPTPPINKPGAPSITSQPVNTSVTAPATATFSVVASGTPTPIYQWMVSVNGGAYSIINGATGSSYTTPATTTAYNGNQYVCMISNASGSVTSANAILTAYPASG